MTHWHPFGIPVDELIAIAINSSGVPFSLRVEWAKSALKDAFGGLSIQRQKTRGGK